MELTTSEKSVILAKLCEANGKSVNQVLKMFDAEQSGWNQSAVEAKQFLDLFQKEFKVMCNVLAESKRSVRNNKGFSVLRRTIESNSRNGLKAALSGVNLKMTPEQAIKINAKSDHSANNATAIVRGKKAISTNEAIALYTQTNKYSGDALSVSEVERNFLSQESALRTAAIRYCKSIGLKVS